MTLSNAQLSELLSRTADEEVEGSSRERALRRAARAAYFWPEEASSLLAEGRPLSELPSVGPWLTRVLARLLLDPSVEPLEPPPIRAGYMTLAEARRVVAGNPDRLPSILGDLQMHTTWSDGVAPLAHMVRASAAYGYEYVAITDHSKGLKIARGMDEDELALQGEEIAGMNRELEGMRSNLRVLRSIEMNLSPEGEEDMDRDALGRLDLVLAAFHSKLRLEEDQTGRYVKALRNPAFDVMAHPRCRMFDRRVGLHADWDVVFRVAAEEGKVLEIDAHPNRQDLDVELLRLAREAGVRFSIGTDAHGIGELAHVEFGVAAAVVAGTPPERILNCLARSELLQWLAERRSRAPRRRVV